MSEHSIRTLTILNLGNNFDREDQIKNKFIAKGLSKIAPTASLVNSRDLEHMSLLVTQDNLLISNLKRRIFAKKKVHSYIKMPNAIIVGYMWNRRHQNSLQRWGWQLENKLQALLNQYNNGKEKILLFSGNDTDLAQAAASGIFTTIIRSNTKEEGSLPDSKEMENPEMLYGSYSSLRVAMVPYAGVGVLRSDLLINQEAPSIEQLIASNNGQTTSISSSDQNGKEIQDIKQGMDDNPLAQASSVSWLDKNYDSGSNFADEMESYNREVKESYRKSIAQRAGNQENSPFLGADGCGACHSQTHKIWEKSSHAKAYLTLFNKDKHMDQSCIGCHVVGFKENGGFLSKETTPNLTGVQCENCHGPGKVHSHNPRIKPEKSARKTCETCHHTPHSSEFNFDKYWKKIEH